MANNLRYLRKKAGLSQTKFASMLGTTRGTYVKIERGDRGLGEKWIDRVARALNIDPSEVVMERRMVPLVGYVGAGAAVYPIEGSEGDLQLSEAALPPESTENTVAVIVRGDSMTGLADDGSLIYYDERYDAPTEEMIGRPCVVWTGDGRVLIKRLFRGKERGLWDLQSTNGHVEVNVLLKYAARVTWIRPG